MTLQAFIDDSYTSNGIFVLAGHIASPFAWAAFSKEWQELLPHHGVLDGSGHYHFKMKEMSLNVERMSRIPVFYSAIENHVLCSVAIAFNQNDLKTAKQRIQVPGINIDWADFNNPYFFAFRGLMDMFHSNRETLASVIPIEEKVDFIFDNQTEKKQILDQWDQYITHRPSISSKYYGAKPRFEDDKEFLPLQAADLWAWWTRKWTEDKTPEKMHKCNFDTPRTARKNLIKIYITYDTEQITTDLEKTIRALLFSREKNPSKK